MTRFDALSPRKKKDGGTYWHKIGAAFPLNGGGYSVVFDSLPLPDAEGRCSFILKEAKPRDDAPRDTHDDYREKRPSGAPAGGYDDGGDSIPFMMEWR